MSRRPARRHREPARRIPWAALRRAARWVVGGGAALALVALGVPWARAMVRTHPYFAVREVVVRHHGRLGADEIRALAGIAIGSSIWDVDAPAVERALLAEGWIQSATVRRELPARVVLAVRENRPVAIVAVADEAPGLYYVAATGRIFAPVGGDDTRDLPYVTGIARADLAGGDAFGPRAVRHALVALRHAGRFPALGTVSELHVDRVAGLTVMPMRPTVPIALGWGDADTKLGQAAEVLGLWAGREAEITTVSCLYDDTVIVRRRTAPVVAAAKSGAATPKRTTVAHAAAGA